MTAQILNFPAPPEEFKKTSRVIHCRGGDSFTVLTTISLATGRGYQIVTHEKSGEMVIARGCAAGEDDSRIVDAAISAWRAAWRLAWMRGREALCNEIHDPRYQ